MVEELFMTTAIYQFDLIRNTNPTDASVPLLRSVGQASNQAEISLQVKDSNHDGNINAQDDFTLEINHQNFHLQGQDGLNALNYFVAPTRLRETHHRTELIHLSSEPSSQVTIGHSLSLSTLNDQGYVNDNLLEAIRATQSEWTLDGNIPISLITGARTFTDAENASWRERPGWPFPNLIHPAWHMTRGGWHLFDGPHGIWPSQWGFGLQDTFRKAFQIGSIFAGLGAIAGGVKGAAFGELAIWMLFTGNYVACELGILRFRPENDARIHNLARPVVQTNSRPEINTAESERNTQANLEIISRRMNAASRDRFFGFSRPFIFGIIAFVDPQSKSWLRHTLRHPLDFRNKSIIGFFGRMAAGLGRNVISGGPAGVAVAGAVGLAAFYGIWGLGNLWYPYYSSSYGPLPYVSSFTRTFSGITAALSTTWLLSAASEQIAKIPVLASEAQTIARNASFSPRNLASAFRTIRETPIVNRQGFESAFKFIHGVREYPLLRTAFLDPVARGFNFLAHHIPALARGAAYSSARLTALEAAMVPAASAPRIGAILALGLAAAGGTAIIAAYLSGRYHDDHTMLDDLRRLGINPT